LNEVQALSQGRVAHRKQTKHDVAVSAQVLGGGMQNNVGAELQRALQVGVAKVLSTTTSAPTFLASSAKALMSSTLSMGLVGVSSHSILVAGVMSERSSAGSASGAKLNFRPNGSNTLVKRR